MQIDLQTDYILVSWEHCDNWSNFFARWCRKKGLQNKIINKVLLSEEWNTQKSLFDVWRDLWEIHTGLITDAIKVSGKVLSTLSKQFFPDEEDLDASLFDLLDKIACDYVLTGKQQGNGSFYQDGFDESAVIHTFGIDLDWETIGNNSRDWAGVVSLYIFPTSELFDRCRSEENIIRIDQYISDPVKAHTANCTQGRLNGLRERLELAARWGISAEQAKAAGTACQLADDIDRNDTPAGLTDAAQDLGGIAANTGPEGGERRRKLTPKQQEEKHKKRLEKMGFKDIKFYPGEAKTGIRYFEDAHIDIIEKQFTNFLEVSETRNGNDHFELVTSDALSKKKQGAQVKFRYEGVCYSIGLCRRNRNRNVRIWFKREPGDQKERSKYANFIYIE